MLYNLHTHAWDPDLLDLFGIPQEMLPQILPSSAAYGVTDGDLVGSEIPIGGVAGISSPRCSANAALRRAKRRTPMAPAAFC